jgi:hypothetical protein
MQTVSKIFLLLLLSLVWGCANQLPPTGGPVDKEPPQLRASIPAQNQTNYTANFMDLEFDEYIQVQQFTQEFLSSPALANTPEFKIKGKNLRLTWKEELLPNQTYTFFFGNAIRDLNEGNELQNLSVTFSTGPDIDSLRLEGKITSILSKEPLAQSFVYLSNKPLHDSSFFPVKPLYQTKTNKEGLYFFQGLKEGVYFLYALEDKNGNKQADNGEMLAFSPSPIFLDDSEKEPKTIQEGDTVIEKARPSLMLEAFPYYEKNKRIVKAVFSVASDCVAFLFQDLFHYPSLQVFEKENKAYHYFIHDTLFVKTKGEAVSNLEIRLQKNTAPLVFDSIPMLAKPLPFQWIPPSQSLIVPSGTVYIFQSNQKIMHYDSTRISCKIDSVEVPFRVEQIGEYGLRVTSEKQGASVQLFDSAVMTMDSVFQKASYLLKREVDASTVSGIWTLTLERESPEFANKSLIIRIVGTKSSLFYPAEPQVSKIYFTYITPGEYTLEVIVDENNNGIWDTGDISAIKEAEKIIKIEKPLQIKAGWEAETSIRL